MHNQPGVAAAIFGPLAKADVNVDMIVQSTAANGKSTDISFTVAKNDFKRALQVIKNSGEELKFADLLTDQTVVKISVIGVGMRSHESHRNVRNSG